MKQLKARLGIKDVPEPTKTEDDNKAGVLKKEDGTAKKNVHFESEEPAVEESARPNDKSSELPDPSKVPAKDPNTGDEVK